jgi:gliding motility-associated-like protein
LGEDITTCIEKETTLEAKVLPVSFSYTFKWSTGETSSQINVKDAGIYWVDVTSRYGIIRDSIEVKQQKCDLNISTSNPLGEVINACTAEELILEIKLPSLLTSYPVKWSTGEVNTQINVKDAGIYWAELVSPYGVFRDSIEIKEEKCIFIPNVFTPNHDGVNETFYIKGIKKGNWQLKIYDRKGLLVYEDNAYKNNWKGDGLPVALYYYQLTNEESTENYKGWVQIMK